MIKVMLGLVLGFVLSLVGNAQSGSFTIQPNTYTIWDLGPGVGPNQIPLPNPGMNTLSITCDVQWNHRFLMEVAAQTPPGPGQPSMPDPNGTVGGFFEATLNQKNYWDLSLGYAADNQPAPIVLCGGRARVRPMYVTRTFPPLTPWDGVMDYVGPTAAADSLTVIAPTRSAVISTNLINTAIPSGRLWLKPKTNYVSITSQQAYGAAYLYLDNPWTATIQWQYLP